MLGSIAETYVEVVIELLCVSALFGIVKSPDSNVQEPLFNLRLFDHKKYIPKQISYIQYTFLATSVCLVCPILQKFCNLKHSLLKIITNTYKQN